MRARIILPIIVIAGLLILFLTFRNRFEHKGITASAQPVATAADLSLEWVAPSLDTVASDSRGALIRYGRDLIANTSRFLGPKGTVAKKSNGLNCQNCHIEAGMRPFGNSFAAVSSTYPKFRDRSGKIESVEFRVNECMERSLNGKVLDSLSMEMRAMVAYMNWIGQHVPKGVKPKSSGTVELKFLDRAADVNLGKAVYITKCQVCHGKNGEGIYNFDSSGYVYPPLWGPHSYNVSAGQYRLSRFAGYVKNNMPFGTTHNSPQLTDEEAWDVAAFVNSQPHPKKLFKYDWPDIRTKPVDYPFGPYADGFSEEQHKYGPFGPIKEARERLAKSSNTTTKK
jgi:thiosulfate dehydrogenase